VTTMSFGTIGRCGCGAIGSRQRHYNGEPLCKRCVRQRKGYLRTIDVARDSVVGTLTPAQRRARRAWLRADRQPSLTSAVEEQQRGIPNDTRQPPARQTRRERGDR